MNNISISRTIYAHEIINPPYSGHSVELELNFTNAKIFEITNWNKSYQPSFTLTVINPKSIGLTDTENYSIEKFFDKVLLAFNLVLKHTSFSRNNADSSSTQLKVESQPIVTEDKDGNKIINITNTLRTSVHITSGIKEDVDEQQVLLVLQKLVSLDILNHISGLKIQDLRKSIYEYSLAMSNFNRLDIFKNLYSSIEHSVNCDNRDRKGIDLDREVNQIASINLTTFKDWREFNARTKHIDKTPQDESKYQEGLNKVGEKLTDMRDTAKNVIIYRLQNVTLDS
jgi:hypothetical protein